MPQSTTQINSCDSVIKLDNGAGNLADISGSSNAVTLNRLVEIGDGVRTFGEAYKLRAACGKDAEITMKIVYSGDDAEALFILNDWYENSHETPRTLQVDIPDSDPGGDRYTFEVFLEKLSFDDNAGSADPILVDVSFKPTGAFSWVVIGS